MRPRVLPGDGGANGVPSFVDEVEGRGLAAKSDCVGGEFNSNAEIALLRPLVHKEGLCPDSPDGPPSLSLEAGSVETIVPRLSKRIARSEPVSMSLPK